MTTPKIETSCKPGNHIGPFTEVWKVASQVRNIDPDDFNQITGEIDESVYAGSEMVWDEVSDNTISCDSCQKEWPVESSVATIAPEQHTFA